VYTPRELVEYGAYRGGQKLMSALPLHTAQRAAERVARALWARGGKRVDYVLANLRVAFPELDELARQAIGRDSYVHFAWNVVDVARSAHWDAREVLEHVEIDGLDHGRAALAKQRGVVALTAHMGNFELAVRAIAAAGIPITAVARPLGNRLLRRVIAEQRTNTGAGLVMNRNVMPSLLRELKSQRAIVMLNDQYIRRSRGTFVPFFGVRASTSLGPAILALRTGAPVVPAYCMRLGPDRHRLVIRPELDLPALTGDRRKDADNFTARCNQALEEIIRAHPEQWMWSHRRFRHSPDLPEDPYGGR
jgi:KDO2-lipid IV(A) lauroyltransferase